MAFHFEDVMGGLLEEREKIFFFLGLSLLLFSHMENQEKHAMGRALLTQKDEISEKDDLLKKKISQTFKFIYFRSTGCPIWIEVNDAMQCNNHVFSANNCFFANCNL